ncbi:hypothetical protein [Streptomyces sp. 142MFCol3.1]|uniref:hypothetical protein n=1 Tax=Streptomyces sp. 142MFCol3.1 TaxID=1172179 RepID=UPI0003FDCB7B|nr:hypothetical protein [Streptomyces sp. 142MFCol3.1]
MTALLVGFATALALSACGVPSSDVIEAGEPASGMFPGSQYSVPVVVSLYFLDDGALKAYPRKMRGPVDLGTAVRRLFDGPTKSESVTATTQLPRLTDTSDVTVGGGNGVSIKLPDDVAPLSRPAVLQLACTVAQVRGTFAKLPADTNRDGALASTSVHVLGDGWTRTQSADSCPEPWQL